MRGIILLVIVILLPWIASAIQQRFGLQLDLARHLVDTRSDHSEEQPPPGWNEAAYLAANPDVAAAVKRLTFFSGYQHYRVSGQAEGRQGGMPEEKVVGAVLSPKPADPAPSAVQPAPVQIAPATVPLARTATATADPALPSPPASRTEPAAVPPPPPNALPPPPLPSPKPPLQTVLQRHQSAGPTIEPVASPSPKPATPRTAPVAMPTGAAVTSIRFGQHPDRLRVVFDTTSPLSLKVNIRPDGRTAQIDMPKAQWKAAQTWRGDKASPVQGYQAVLRPDGWRLDIQTRAPVTVKQLTTLPPDGSHGHRVVLDLAPRPIPPSAR